MSAAKHDPREERCPPCANFFRKLEKDEENGLLSQVVRVQERGEPKSGTGMMFDWATGVLVRTCSYLQKLFGEERYVYSLCRAEHLGYGLVDVFMGRCKGMFRRALQWDFL